MVLLEKTLILVAISAHVGILHCLCSEIRSTWLILIERELLISNILQEVMLSHHLSEILLTLWMIIHERYWILLPSILLIFINRTTLHLLGIDLSHDIHLSIWISINLVFSHCCLKHVTWLSFVFWDWGQKLARTYFLIEVVHHLRWQFLVDGAQIW